MTWGVMIVESAGRYSQITMVDEKNFDESVRMVREFFPGTNVRKYGFSYVCCKGEIPDEAINDFSREVSGLVERANNSNVLVDVKGLFEKLSA